MGGLDAAAEGFKYTEEGQVSYNVIEEYVGETRI